MEAGRQFDPNYWGEIDKLGPDRAIAQLAERQHGVAARRQLLALALSAKEIAYRVRIGRLHQIHRGVYAIGHSRLTRRGRWMAAILAGGPGAALSHRDAAALHGIRADSWTLIEITTSRRRGARPGIQAHRATLPADELIAVDGIRATTVARTLVDLAAVISVRGVERAMAEAEHRRFGDRPSLGEVLARHPRAKGSGAVRALLATRANLASITRSELEEAFLAYARGHALPEPQLNTRVWVGDDSVECDAVWHAARVVVELDSREFHHTPTAFGSDRLKSRRLSVAGWQPIRVAAEHLHTPELAGDLRALLADPAR